MEKSYEENLLEQISRWSESVETVSRSAKIIQKNLNSKINVSRQQGPIRHFYLLPRIRVDDNNVICDGSVIPLQQRSLSLELFKAFISQPDYALTRQELIERVYIEEVKTAKSLRLIESLNQNIVKLMSRTRRFANDALNGEKYQWIEWFVYNPDIEKWCLFRLTNSYLIEKERQLKQMGLIL